MKVLQKKIKRGLVHLQKNGNVDYLCGLLVQTQDSDNSTGNTRVCNTCHRIYRRSKP